MSSSAWWPSFMSQLCGIVLSKGQGRGFQQCTRTQKATVLNFSQLPEVKFLLLLFPVGLSSLTFVLPCSAGQEGLIPFSRCHQMPLEWSFTEDHVFEIDETYETGKMVIGILLLSDVQSCSLAYITIFCFHPRSCCFGCKIVRHT